MPKRIVAFDRIAYVSGQDKNGGNIVADASRGDEVELSDAEAARLDALGATYAGDAPEAPPVDDHSSPSQKADADPTNPPYPEAETAKAAGIGQPQGTGVELHDNRLAEGLSKFLPSNESGGPATAPTAETSTLASDEELAAMGADKLVAYLNQHNDEVDRVEAMETAEGGKNRVTVTKAIASIRDAQAGRTVDEGDTGSTE